jgi:Ankyrin repeats (many copies)
LSSILVRSAGAPVRSRDNAAAARLRTRRRFWCGAEPGWHETLSVVDDLPKLGAKVKVKSRKGLIALHFASACERQDAATALILAGAIVEAKTRARRTPLHLAAMSGRHNVVRALAGLGACVDSMDLQGCSAPQSASARGHTSTVRALLELGAIDGGRDVRGRNALDAAARAGHVKIVGMPVVHLAEHTQIGDTVCTAYLGSAVNRGSSAQVSRRGSCARIARQRVMYGAEV